MKSKFFFKHTDSVKKQALPSTADKRVPRRRQIRERRSAWRDVLGCLTAWTALDTECADVLSIVQPLLATMNAVSQIQ